MPVSSLALSIDSFVVATALSIHAPARHMAPLVALFGACDTVASTFAPALGAQIPGADLYASIALMAWGGLMMLNQQACGAWYKSPLWAYLLPPFLALDNLVVPNGSPLANGCASSCLAALGWALGLMIRRYVAWSDSPRWIGAQIAVSGLLLVV